MKKIPYLITFLAVIAIRVRPVILFEYSLISCYNSIMTKVRTRFAPSPTGDLHIGGLRTALYAYALARHSNGEFILRIEDTDKKREVKGGKEKIKEILKKFGINWDDYFVQSERLELYKKAAQKLVAEGHAYKDEGAIRIKIPKDEKVSFKDFVLEKEITWDTNTLTDLVLLKSDGYPTYHLAVVVDDNDMGITHVLRGHDWLPSTPLHLLIYKFLGYTIPEIGHLTDIMDPKGGKLSKRKGSTSCDGLMKEGYLPEAILNCVMLLGWAPKDNRELFTLDQFVKAFDPKGFQKSNPVFNKEKLNWFNDQYKLKISPIDFAKYVSSASVYANRPKFSETVAASGTVTGPRASNVSEFDALIKPFFIDPNPVGPVGPNSGKHLKAAYEALSSLSDWNKENLDKTLLDVVKKNNFKTGDFFMDFRIALTGERFTMPINDFVVYYAELFGKKDILDRLKKEFS